MTKDAIYNDQSTDVRPATYIDRPDGMSDKSIDFDPVADLYDVLVDVETDLEFWKDEARAVSGPVLELMCGTGRIGGALVSSDAAYTGLDYCQKLLEQFEMKLANLNQVAALVCGDATEFDLSARFDLIFVGFSSLSEVVDNEGKVKLLKCVRRHLGPSGRFVFSLHNPETTSRQFDGSRTEPLIRHFDGRGETLEFSTHFQTPSPAGIVTGSQFYVIKDGQGRVVEEREQATRFHLITQSEIEALLAASGFQILERWGDYDRSEFHSECPFMIYRCTGDG